MKIILLKQICVAFLLLTLSWQCFAKQKATANEILIGFSGEDVKNLDGVTKYPNIINTSWMSYTTNGILMNNEYNSELYSVNSNNFTIEKYINLKNVLSPVYYSPEINRKIFIAGYGDGAGNNAGVVVTDATLSNVKEYSINTAGNHIHFIDKFTPKNKPKDAFLIAVNLGNKKLQKFDTGTDKFSDLYTFVDKNGKSTKPRHFVQIPGTNNIVVITEQLNAELELLRYQPVTDKDNEKFKSINTYNLSQLLEGNEKGLTGAEIKYKAPYLYATIRLYASEFNPYNQPNSINGYLAKFIIKNNKLILVNKVHVGRNPRYFDIDNNNIAYVVNQDSDTVMQVDLNNMKILEAKTKNFDSNPLFLLLPPKK